MIKLTFLKKREYEVRDEAVFFSMVRRAFQKRRKTLLNSLVSEEDERFSKKNVEATLCSLQIDPMRRAETLTLLEWARLVNGFDS